MGNIDSPFSPVIVLNILLLEDRDEDALMVERALKNTGCIYSLKRARNKAEFIAQLDAGFDLILADYHLADCNALDALRQLQERNLDIPLILVSRVAREEEANEPIGHGAADYLSGDRLSRLGPAIAAAFEHKALRMEADDVARALERSREEFDHAFDNAAIGVALTSLDGRWLKVNQALCRITGYAEPELLATDCHSVTHVDDVAGDVDLMRRLVGGEVGSTQREKRYLHKLGHPVWVQVTASLVRGRDGAARYRMLQVLDITHRKEAEERFQATFNQAAVGIAHTTIEGAILEVNRKLCDILGFTAQELMRLTTRELTFTGDRDKQDSLRRQVIAGQLPHFQAEKRFVRKNGQVIWVNRTVTLARHAASGEPYLIQVFEDITERKRTEERLERANRARRVLAECSRALVHASSESELLQQMCRIIVESGGYKQGWIGFATGDPTRPLHPVAPAGYAGDEPFPTPETLTANGTYRGVAAEALASGAPVVAKDILNDPRHEWRRPRALRHGFQSSIGLPLKAEDSVLGVLVMHASEPDAFDHEEIALLTTLSEDIAFGIGSSRAAAARRQAEANLKRLIRARRVMAECSRILVHATDEMEMLESMCRVVVESGGYRQSWIGFPTGDPMRPVYPAADAGYGSDAPMTAPVTWTSGSYHGLAAEALAAGETRIARDILNDPQHERKRDRARQLGYQCSIALPLKGEKEALGVIVIHASEPEAFDRDEIALLTELADDIAYAIVGLRTRVARRNAEKALRESEERFRVLTELSSDWSWEQDADYRFTSLSRTVKSHAGISAEDHVGKARWELPRTTPFNTTWDEHKAALAARQPFHDLLLRRVLEDGSENYVLVSGQPVFDASGTFKGYRGVAKNITDKIRAEMALRESERRFREMFDQAAVGITRVHLDGVLVDVNQKFCNMLGYAKDELLGRHIREITHPDDYAQGLQYRERVVGGTAKSVTGEKRFVRKDGTILWARRTMSAACDDAGNPLYVISVVEDITERKELEQRFEVTFNQAARLQQRGAHRPHRRFHHAPG
ncbi:MAG: PAS domain S-box protein [Betaproteobacteria bacterium]|nr:PAS domain S-box protein [Betaproteobacteria bacterium]